MAFLRGDEMRVISEQELKDRLEKHGKYLRGEEDGSKANLSGADLSGANLYGANLSRANLSGADLSGANLYGANLSRANLSGADLYGADLYGADLSGANLYGANLSRANLSGADLYGADLSGADLSGANLSGANIVTFQFQKHFASFTFDGVLKIGCLMMPISEWVIGYKEIGKREGYSDEQIEAYGGFIELCLRMFEKRNPK
jgi:hypothetical protein